MKKNIIVGVIIIVLFGGFHYLKSTSIKMFPTQAECEKETQKICDNTTMCDYKCPRGFHKGWWLPRETPVTIQETCAQSGDRIGAQ